MMISISMCSLVGRVVHLHFSGGAMRDMVLRPLVKELYFFVLFPEIIKTTSMVSFRVYDCQYIINVSKSVYIVFVFTPNCDATCWHFDIVVTTV